MAVGNDIPDATRSLNLSVASSSLAFTSSGCECRTLNVLTTISLAGMPEMSATDAFQSIPIGSKIGSVTFPT